MQLHSEGIRDICGTLVNKLNTQTHTHTDHHIQTHPSAFFNTHTKSLMLPSNIRLFAACDFTHAPRPAVTASVFEHEQCISMCPSIYGKWMLQSVVDSHVSHI